ncbi:unnamed protein product [Rhizophagus irregularis]|uniref:Uncharacterized protein n=1 Tax=Rhizophagus irregularis TaxID=588596 RepID=A0A915ZW68_9GLOM|nr:unnamed protein product [Rhizophagus irregularis]CAB5188287.1 unnamed protein product [Rhizophagus irregularis]CAB5389738.1 unnamed protein product [Rhizophagus irregularis]
METLCNELKVEIFRYVFTPIALVLLNCNWYSTFQDPHVRAEWIIYKYGRAHALFHAIRLGNHFVTVEVVQILAKKAIILRYFMQRLMIQFGTYDPKLIKLIEMRSRGNDLELFHYLTAGALTINQAPAVLLENLNYIEDLNKKFMPLRSSQYINSVLRPKDIPAYRSPFGGATENYLSRDGYENNRQLGFRLTDKIIEDSIKLFESRINVIGESLLNSFHKLRGDSTPPIVESTRFQNG